MYNARWLLSLFIALIAACSAPGTAIAPSHAPVMESAGFNMRPITTVATALLEPLELSRLVVSPISLVRSDAGEQRTRQVLITADGGEVLRVESALDGSLRLIAKSDVTLEGGGLSESGSIARALRQLIRLGLEIPVGAPTVRTAAGRILVVWTRQVHGVPVPNDGTRVVLSGAGALVGLAIEESPLAAAPSRIAQVEGALRAAIALLPSGTEVDEPPVLAWVLPTNTAGEPTAERAPRRLAWCVNGVLLDGTAIEVQLDAGSLALLGWDGAP